MAIALPEPELSRAGVSLRAWRQPDVKAAVAAGRDGVIGRYRYSLPATRDAANAWITATETDRRDDRRLELAIVADGVVVGSVALADVGHGNAMVRYWLLAEGRGRGLATSAVSLLAAWAFSELQIGRLGALVEVGNAASVAVLERCEFVREGRLRQHMTDRSGQRVDTLIYGLLTTDLSG